MKHLLILSCLLISCLCAKANPTEPSQQKLDLRFMNLSKIDLDSARATTLVELDLSGNPITTLPTSLRYAKQMKVLRVNFCSQIDLAGLADLASKMPLEELEIDNCNIVYLPMELAGIFSLKKLSLKNNQLEEVPWNLFYNANLEQLDLANNKIESFECREGELPSLKYLSLAGNPCLKDERTYSSLQMLASLQVLDCSGATKLPHEWTLPASLADLRLDDLRADFPGKVSSCDNLKKLSLQNNNYNSADKIFEAMSCSNITELRMSGRSIDKVPQAITKCKALQYLELGADKLTQIPNDLAGLTQLKKVSLKIRDTASVTNFIKALVSNNENLEELEISGTQMKTLPAEIGDLRGLRKLTLNNLGVRSFGEGAYKLRSLTEIDARGNDLQEDEVQRLVNTFPSARIYYDQLTPSTSQNYINKPFPNVEIKEEVFTFNANKGTTVTTENGTRITIPANAIVDKDGKVVKEPITLKFTPYFDPLTVFASGIPMSADSAGSQKNFASAGMFTLNAEYGNNKQAFVKKGAKIDVALVSDMPNQSYKYWYLDTVKKNWVQIGADSLQSNRRVKPAPFKRLPRMPKDPSKGTFAKINVKRYPEKKKRLLFNINAQFYAHGAKTPDSLVYNPLEMKDYNRVTWYYLGENHDEFNKIFSAKKSPFFGGWSAVHGMNNKVLYHASTSKEGVEMAIRPDKEKDCFIITFYTSKDSVCIPAIPESQFENPEKERSTDKKLYQEYYQVYQANPTTRTERLGRYNQLYQGYQKQMDDYNVLSQAYNNSKVSGEEYQKLYDAFLAKETTNMMRVLKLTGNVTRALELTSFGTFNCDYFANIENPIVCAPVLRDNNNAKLHIFKITLVDMDVNSYISVYGSSTKLNPHRNYWLFAEAPGKKVGFAVVNAHQSVDNVQMKLISGNNLVELRESMMAKK